MPLFQRVRVELTSDIYKCKCLGEAIEGVSCVKFGMLADERDLADLIRLVAQRGADLEQSSQYLESLADLIRQGIEAANEDLRRENEEKLVNEVLRRTHSSAITKMCRVSCASCRWSVRCLTGGRLCRPSTRISRAAHLT